MRRVLTCLLAVTACLCATAPAAQAEMVKPRSASAFADSVGVATHIVYYDTAYADWPRVVARLQELGVRHLRDGVYGNPSPAWRDWNERYYRAVELAAAHGMRFTFGMGQPGSQAGTLDELIGVVAGRLRPAAEGLEAPNEFDHFVGGPRWPQMLAAYGRTLYRRAKAHPSLRRLPVVGPSLAEARGLTRIGDQRSWLDRGNIHPYTGGLSPDPRHLRAQLAAVSAVSGSKPVWATEAGFHNALHATAGQPPVSEPAAAIYHLRTFLEHFDDGIARTYAYELVDEKPEPGRRDPEQHFGLLRSDLSPKPAFTALKNLLSLVGRDERAPRLRPLRISTSGARRDVRRLVLRRGDGTYLVALWRTASVWDRRRRRPVRVTPRRVTVTLPGAAGVAVADPVISRVLHPLRLRRGRVRIALGSRPLLLEATRKGVRAERGR
jgi:hypothetical protein